MSIEEKYGIVYIENERYYSYDFSVNRIDLEHSTPRFMKIDGKILEEHSWGRLILMFVDYLFSKKNISNHELLSFLGSWSDKPIFVEKQRSRTDFELKCGIYVNTNHTSIHSFRLIRELLIWQNYNLDECFILIKKCGIAEVKEVRDYYISFNIEHFASFLKEEYLVNKYHLIDKHINYLKNLDLKLTDKIMHSAYSMFLIDNLFTMSIYKNDFLYYVKNKISLTNVQYNHMENLLNLYYKYLKNFKVRVVNLNES